MAAVQIAQKEIGPHRFLIAVFHLPGSGKIPDKGCELADVWLRRAIKQGTRRSALALSFPDYQEQKLIESFKRLKSKR